jgi:hypothetical protein
MNAFNSQTVRAMYLAHRSTLRQRDTCGAYARYEARKREWATLNPGATAEEYQRAMTAIAREVGV